LSVSVQAAVEIKETVNNDVAAAALPVGFPILILDRSEEIVEPALLFMTDRYLTAGSRFVANTAKAVAEDLRDWWAYLVEFDRPWEQAATEDVAFYRDAMLQTISPRTHERYGETTVTRRVGTVLSFYSWAREKGLVRESIDWKIRRQVSISRNKPAKAHLQADLGLREVSALLPKSRSAPDEKVKILLPQQVRSLMAALGPLPSEVAKGGIRSSRGRLVAEVCLNSGVRIEEARELTVYQIQNLVYDALEPLRVAPLYVTLTKGGKPRTVDLPSWLVTELLAYIDGERTASLKEIIAKRRRGHNGLFVNNLHSGGAIGAHTSKRSLQEEFEKGVRKAGLVVNVEKTDPETGQTYFRQTPRFSSHDLRHTYAAWTYYARRKHGDSEPWLYIQAKLGHRSVETTMKTYLRVVKEFEAVISDGVVSAFQRIRQGT
jgi:integrase